MKALCGVTALALGAVAVDGLLGERALWIAGGLLVLALALFGYVVANRRRKWRAFERVLSNWAEREALRSLPPSPSGIFAVPSQS